MNKDPRLTEIDRASIPPSGRGPDGKIRRMTEEEHKAYIESVLRRLDEIEQIPNEPGDPPDEEWMRNMDESKPHRPPFNGCYEDIEDTTRSPSSQAEDIAMDTDPRLTEIDRARLPESCLGPDGKFKIEDEAERRQRLERAREMLKRIGEIPNQPGDPPDEVWMRGIDEMRPHRPLFKDYY